MNHIYSVNVYPSTISIKKGECYSGAYASVYPDDESFKDVIWSSSDTHVASVDASSGCICAKSVGTARIYACATDGSSKRGYCTVTVTSPKIYVSEVLLSNLSVSIQEGDSHILKAKVCPINATNKSLKWSSSNNSVATVINGTVYAKAAGTARITVTTRDGSEETASCSVTVIGNVPVSSITVNPSKLCLEKGDSITLAATVYPIYATEQRVLWSSSNKSVATINPISGLVTAHEEGVVTIYATADDDSRAKGTCRITVKRS